MTTGNKRIGNIFRARMKRYLMFISYLGTKFRSVQREVNHSTPSQLDPDSVQGILEICLQKLSPSNNPKVVLCSRTDQGVHALRSAVHVDLEGPKGKEYNPIELTYVLNRCFDKHDVELRIQSCQIVPETFHARHSAKLRSYLYRMAVRRPDAPQLPSKGRNYIAVVPFSEWKRCHFIQKTEFDIEKLKQAASLYPGVKDFRSFMGKSGGDVPTVREIYSLNVTPGFPLLPTHYSPFNDEYHYWDITCTAKSFLYRQIRRTVGVFVAVAQGTLPVEHVQFMLDHPSPDSWNTKAVTVPAYGLYLVNVEYDPADIICPSTDNSAEKVKNE